MLVTGCPRSGTRYYAGWLKQNGHDVGHERMASDGVVSWMWAVDALSYPYKHPGELRRDHEFSEVSHLVRDPLKCIASLTTIGEKAWSFLHRHVGVEERHGMVGRAASVWLRWNRVCEDQASKRVRIEDVPYDPSIVSNLRPHAPIEWADLECLPFVDELSGMARRYGYA